MDARKREGKRLRASSVSVEGLRALAERRYPWCPQAVQRQQERFVQKFQEAMAAVVAAVTRSRPERALSEAAAYALRIDVDEEMQRLKAHLDEIAVC